jgi:hypothetical protein
VTLFVYQHLGKLRARRFARRALTRSYQRSLSHAARIKAPPVLTQDFQKELYLCKDLAIIYDVKLSFAKWKHDSSSSELSLSLAKSLLRYRYYHHAIAKLWKVCVEVLQYLSRCYQRNIRLVMKTEADRVRRLQVGLLLKRLLTQLPPDTAAKYLDVHKNMTHVSSASQFMLQHSHVMDMRRRDWVRGVTYYFQYWAWWTYYDDSEDE